MSDVLQMVDVVVELRDARIPRATAHPLMEGWVGSRGFVRVLNRMDSVPARALNEWSAAIGAAGSDALALALCVTLEPRSNQLSAAVSAMNCWRAHARNVAEVISVHGQQQARGKL